MKYSECVFCGCLIQPGRILKETADLEKLLGSECCTAGDGDGHIFQPTSEIPSWADDMPDHTDKSRETK